MKTKIPRKCLRRVILPVFAGFLLSFMLFSCNMLRDSEKPSDIDRDTQNVSPAGDDSESVRQPDILDGESGDENAETVSDSTVIGNVPHSISPEAESWASHYEAAFGAGSADEVILDENGIRSYNSRIIENCNAVYDMSDVPEAFTGDEIREMILSYSPPKGDKYDKTGTHIDSAKAQYVLDNRALDAVPESVIPRRAVITERCDLKSLPTPLDYFEHGDKHYSAIQETELIVSFPVLVLHESADGGFLFVRSYYYNGWIPSSSAAYADDVEYLMFASPENYVTVTEPYVAVGGNDGGTSVKLSMGTRLPYVRENSESFFVSAPVRDEDGRLTLVEEAISKEHSYYGSLPYTVRNYYRQAFRYIGTYYGWGGAGGGVDCSGFVCSVFRSFGIYLPRNTGMQSRYNGEVIDISALTLSSLAELKYPASIHRKGHVMLFLGIKDSVPYIIHAPRGGEQVSVASLDFPGNLTNICVLH